MSSIRRCPAGDEYMRRALSTEARMFAASHAFALRHASIKMRRPKSRISSCCSSATVRFDSNLSTSSTPTQLRGGGGGGGRFTRARATTMGRYATGKTVSARRYRPCAAPGRARRARSARGEKRAKRAAGR